MSALVKYKRAGRSLGDFLLGVLVGAMSGYAAMAVDPEWLYLILGLAVAVVTGSAELWRQRGVESKIGDLESKVVDLQFETRAMADRIAAYGDLESKVTDLRVDVMYHARLLSDLDTEGGDGGS